MGPIKHLQLGNGYLHSGRFTSVPGLSVHCCCRNTVKKCLPGHAIAAYLRRVALSLKPTEVTPIEVKVFKSISCVAMEIVKWLIFVNGKRVME
mgnify:CR=1 FL=1